MARTIQLALARVYRSISSYGEEAFTIPPGSPKTISANNELLEIHLGRAPGWLRRAEARAHICEEAMLRGRFQNEPVARQRLNQQLSNAAEQPLAGPKHKWLVALILRSTIEWQDSDVNDEPWIWLNMERFFEAERLAEGRIPSLDLAARVLSESVPSVLDEIVVLDRVYVARDVSFEDAFGMPQFYSGVPVLSFQSKIELVQAALSSSELEEALRNALVAPAVLRDNARPDRLKAALRSDLLADDGGSYGRYELLREMQPVLMRASVSRSLSVMFVDMNGLKQINDTHGHDAGDEAIAQFRAAVREAHAGALFRTGGDEFVMFCLGAQDEAIALARKILAAVEARQIGGSPLSASVGLILATNPCEAPREIVKRADGEMYRAKVASRVAPSGVRPSILAVEGRDVEVVAWSVGVVVEAAVTDAYGRVVVEGIDGSGSALA